MPYFTNRIWQFDKEVLGPREGAIILDEDTCLDVTKEDGGPLHVASGLGKRDLVVFLGFVSAPVILIGDVPTADDLPPGAVDIASSPIEEYETGYIVTHVNKDGSGILVSGDMMQSDPLSWANPRTVGLGLALAQAGYGFDEFGLPELQQFISTRSKP